MEKLNSDEVREVLELFAMSLALTLPQELRSRIADHLHDLGAAHSANSPNAGTHAKALARLVRDPLQQSSH